MTQQLIANYLGKMVVPEQGGVTDKRLHISRRLRYGERAMTRWSTGTRLCERKKVVRQQEAMLRG